MFMTRVFGSDLLILRKKITGIGRIQVIADFVHVPTFLCRSSITVDLPEVGSWNRDKVIESL